MSKIVAILMADGTLSRINRVTNTTLERSEKAAPDVVGYPVMVSEDGRVWPKPERNCTLVELEVYWPSQAPAPPTTEKD